MTTGTQQTSAQQQTQNQGQVNPWAPAVPALTSLLGNVSGIPQTPTAGQSDSAYQPVQAAINNLDNNFGQPVANQANAFLTGDPFNILNPAYQQYQKTLAPFTNPNNLDPTKNPATASLIDSIRTMISQGVDSQFAGAGRDLSGANTAADSRAFTQALAPTLFGQYNQNTQNLINAGSQLFGAAGNTSAALGGNVTTGANLAAAQPGIAGAPAQALASASLQHAMLPSQLAAGPASLLTSLAGLGNTSQNQGASNTNATTQITPSLLSSILSGLNAAGGISGIGGILGRLGQVASGSMTLT